MTVMLITKVTYNYGNIPTFKTMLIVLDNPILKCLIFPPQNTRTQSRKLLNIYYYYHRKPESFHKHSSAHFTIVKLQQKYVFKRVQNVELSATYMLQCYTEINY